MSDSQALGGAQHQRFNETLKFLPVAFVCVNIIGLYTIYSTLHIWPLLQDPQTFHTTAMEFSVFNVISLMLAVCYVKCILVHPGTIPEAHEDPSWCYTAPSGSRKIGRVNLQEQKKSGEQRHCKWCTKYKPDRCHHCRVCQQCILKMDHHCPWIYNCVGFKNHKYFFLLLLYTTMATHMIIWFMLPSVKASMDSDTPFARMFLLLFGETLACFLGLLVTVFFLFHIWLTTKAMTTIEFCEKALKRSQHDINLYDRGWYKNLKTVLGENELYWLVPCSPLGGDGLTYITEDKPLSHDLKASVSAAKMASKSAASGSSGGCSRVLSSAGTGQAPEYEDCSECSDGQRGATRSEDSDKDQKLGP